MREDRSSRSTPSWRHRATANSVFPPDTAMMSARPNASLISAADGSCSRSVSLSSVMRHPTAANPAVCSSRAAGSSNAGVPRYSNDGGVAAPVFRRASCTIVSRIEGLDMSRPRPQATTQRVTGVGDKAPEAALLDRPAAKLRRRSTGLEGIVSPAWLPPARRTPARAACSTL